MPSQRPASGHQDGVQRGSDRLRPHDLAAAQEQVLQAALERFGGDVAVLYSFNPITGRFLPPWRPAGETRSRTSETLQEPRTAGLTQRVLQDGHLFVEAVDKVDLAGSAFAREEGIRSFAALRLEGSRWEKPLGVLYLDFREKRNFSAEDQERLVQFAEEAFDQLEAQWRLARYREVSRISAEINHDLRTIEDLFTTLDQHAGGILDTHYFFSLGVFYLMQEEVKLLYRFREGRPEEVKHPGGEAFAALKDQQGVLRWPRPEGAPTAPDFTLAPPGLGPQFAPRSYLVAPLVVRKVLLGFLCAAHPDPDAFDDEDERVLALLAQHVSSALNNIRLFLNLKRLAEAGQFLAEPLGEEEALQRAVDEILSATQADVVVLYPFHAERKEFRLPPKFAGTLLNPTFPQPTTCREGDPPYRVLATSKPVYLPDSGEFWAKTGDDEPPPIEERFLARERIVSLAALSLRSHGGVAGVLFLNYRRQQPFDAPQRQMIEGLAFFAAAALHNARRFIEAGSRRAEEHAIIQEIDRAIDQATDHRSVLKVILEGANRLLKADAAAILLPSHEEGGETESEQAFFVAEAIGRHSEDTRGWSTRDATTSILNSVLERRSSVLISDLPSDPHWKEVAAYVRPGTRSELDVPLLANGEVVGVLNFESADPNHFTQQDQEFLVLLANQILLVVSRARATEIAQQEARDRKLLMDLTRAIIGETDLEKLLRLILEQALQMAGADAGVLLLNDDERGDLEVRFEIGTPNDPTGTRVSLDQGVIGYAARTKTSLSVDPTEQPWSGMNIPHAARIRSELAVPLLAGGQLRGVLNLESPTPKKFRRRDQKLTEALADLAVIALQNAENLYSAQTELARFNVLAEAGEKLGRLADLSQLAEAYQVVLDLAVRQCGGLAVMRRLILDERRFALVRSAGESGLQRPFASMALDDGLNGRAYAEQSLQYEPDLHAAKGSPPAHPSDPSARSLLVTPVRLGEKYYGNLGASHTSPYHFNPADRRMFEGLAQILAITHNRLEVIQEKHDLEKAKEQSEILGWMGVASFQIAHRLGNRLGAVTARLNQIEDRLVDLGIRDDQIETYLSRIRNQTQMVLELGDRLTKEVKKLEHRNPRAFLLGQLAMELASYYDSLSESISVVIVSDGPDPLVYADRDQASDILDNLLQNSASAIERASNTPGMMEIRILQDGEMGRIDLRDNGCGIPAEDLPLIFSFLYSTKRSSGFGLWSGLRQARINGGDLFVTSSVEGEGSIFTLTLPLAAQALESPQSHE